MELMSGGDLMNYLEKHDQISEEELQWIGSECLAALRFLHNKKIVYRDIKLDNVMIATNGHCRLLDFGMVKFDVDESNKCMSFCGTPNYLAPEIIEGEPYDFKVDIWALGVMLWELKYGFSPFNSADQQKLFKVILAKEPCWNYTKEYETSPEFRSLINVCLRKLPSKRYDTQGMLNDPFFTSRFGYDPSDQMIINQNQAYLSTLNPDKHKDKVSKHFNPDVLKMKIDNNENEARIVSEFENQVFKNFGQTDKSKLIEILF